MWIARYSRPAATQSLTTRNFLIITEALQRTPSRARRAPEGSCLVGAASGRDKPGIAARDRDQRSLLRGAGGLGACLAGEGFGGFGGVHAIVLACGGLVLITLPTPARTGAGVRRETVLGTRAMGAVGCLVRK